jgi:hypothetical protein
MDGLAFSSPLNDSCSAVLPRLRQALERSGLSLLETFDLQAARLASTDCTCPHHGTADCDCQMLVLMVYGEGAPPATLMLHGSDGQTWISLPDDPARRMDPYIAAAIELALSDIRA